MADASINLGSGLTVRRSSGDDYPRQGFHRLTDWTDHSREGTWTDLDVSGDAPAGATGVILLNRTTGTGEANCGVRAKGSTDGDLAYTTFQMDDTFYQILFAPLDTNRVFQQKRSLYSELMVIGYTDDRVQFPWKNWIDVTPGTTGSYQTVDLSGYIPETVTVGARHYTPTAAIVVLATTDISARHGYVRAVGSSESANEDDMPYLYEDRAGSGRFEVVKLNASREIEAYVQDNTVSVYLIGYCLPPVEVFSDPPSIFPGQTDQWTTIDVSGDATEETKIAIVQHRGGLPENEDPQMVVKPHGTSDDYLEDRYSDKTSFVYGWTTGTSLTAVTDYISTYAGSRLIDAYVANGGHLGDMMLRGYSEEDDPQNLPAGFEARHSSSTNLKASFDGQATINLPAGFDNNQHNGTPVNLPAGFTARHADSRNLLGGGIIKNASSETLLGTGNIRHSASINLPAGFRLPRQDLLGEFTARHSDLKNLHAEFIVRQSDSHDLPITGVIRHSSSLNLLGEMVVRHSASLEGPAGMLEISRDEWVMQGVPASVYRDIGVIS